MDISKIAELLMLISPSISASLTIVGCCIFIFRKLKKIIKNKDNEIDTANKKLEKAYNDIATLKTKIVSIEKYLVEKKEDK